jgi:succinoglycan biosynthesis transport protein ExoP
MTPDNLPAIIHKNGQLSPARPDPFAGAEYMPESKSGGLKFNDILFILFRHKRKVVICALVGILAAAGIYFLLPYRYESQAKLLVRYVVDRSAVDNLDPGGKDKDVTLPSESAINSEVEILTSSDLALLVAKTIGPAKILNVTEGKATDEAAARAIQKGMEVTVVPASNIISVTYRNPDPKTAAEVCRELVKRYLVKHLEVHRALGAYEYVSAEADKLKVELDKTTEDLNALKAQAGVTSLAEDTVALANLLSQTEAQYDEAVSSLAAQQARVGEIEKLNGQVDEVQAQNRKKAGEAATVQVSSELEARYKSLIAALARLRDEESVLLSKFTPQNRIIKTKQAQIADMEKQQKDMERTYPALASIAATAAAGGQEVGRLDAVSERARLTELQSRVATLKPRLDTLRQKSVTLRELGPKISELSRQLEVEETNYKYYGASLEKARVDETLNPSRMPNISVVQEPSPASKAKRDLKKILPIVLGGGLAVGLAWALAIELVIDRTIKRAADVEGRLRIPLLLSIPDLTANRRLRLRASNADDLDRSGMAFDEDGELLRPFCESIRDQLGLFFNMNQMNHKPKMVAVTGLAKNAGASALAAGLASALSDSGAGKVLLVDKMVAPRHFYEQLSEFKASDVDYVVFDMPPISENSATLPMVGFMDKVLLVVEAEKSNPSAIKRAYGQLMSKVDTSVIFNKSRSYGPRWLEVEV